ncbi:hypothetical protein HYC85_006334 [Camellia sinensis]|uniref:CCHC-type domain-containing protein n=1 Tax=Camellia sinensis TaxID=4442 RepID=A0A7J7HN88_CAMSI|nr:hypothetical protein HYC85_006334 [Camellia sinensis]
MPRYDDRYSNTRLYVGRLSTRTRSRDLEGLFSRYGSDPRDADDARYGLNGREFDGSRIIVEFAKGVSVVNYMLCLFLLNSSTRSILDWNTTPRGSREYLGRGPPPGSGRCFNCGLDGHWARDCKAGDWKNKCYRCGERGHIERNCQNSPKKLKRGRSYSRSPVRSRSPRRGRSRSYSRSRSYMFRSRSPPRRERIVEREEKQARSYSRSPVPTRATTPPPKTRKHSPTPEEEDIVRERDNSPSPKRGRPETEQDRSDYSESPRENSRSPVRESPAAERYQSPSDANGRSPTASPRDDRSPVDDDDNHQSPRGSETP